jgi:hypothetical protein
MEMKSDISHSGIFFPQFSYASTDRYGIIATSTEYVYFILDPKFLAGKTVHHPEFGV